MDIDSDAGNVYVLEAGIYSISASISIKAIYDTGINGDFEIGKLFKIVHVYMVLGSGGVREGGEGCCIHFYDQSLFIMSKNKITTKVYLKILL